MECSYLAHLGGWLPVGGVRRRCSPGGGTWLLCPGPLARQVHQEAVSRGPAVFLAEVQPPPVTSSVRTGEAGESGLGYFTPKKFLSPQAHAGPPVGVSDPPATAVFPVASLRFLPSSHACSLKELVKGNVPFTSPRAALSVLA